MSKITAYGALTSPQYDDVFPVVDVHDVSMASTGTTKKATLATLIRTVWPSGDATGVTDAANINTAVAAVPAHGGVVRLAASADWYIQCGSVSINKSGVYIDGTGCYIKAVGSGDMIRMYDSSVYGSGRQINGGGILGMPVIDGSATTGNSCALHLGDIYQASVYLYPRGFTAGTTSKGVWLDNNYYWTEGLHGQIVAWGNTTGVVFDNSANLAGATGSFDRADLDITTLNNSVGDGVSMINNTFIHDGNINIRGNFGWASTATVYYVLRFGGTSHIVNSVLNIGVELDGSGTTAPSTIFFSASPFNYIQDCYGIIDFSAGQQFTLAPHNSGNFRYSGTVLGDTALTAMQNLEWYPVWQTINANGQTFFGQFTPAILANNAGAFTGLIINPGGYGGQRLTILNRGTGSLTFAAVGTSNVADGASDVIAPATAATYIWDATTSLWFRTV